MQRNYFCWFCFVFFLASGFSFSATVEFKIQGRELPKKYTIEILLPILAIMLIAIFTFGTEDVSVGTQGKESLRSKDWIQISLIIVETHISTSTSLSKVLVR